MSYRPKGETTHYILCIASLGGRRLAVRTAMEHHIGALPRTPFPASRDFPSRGNERYEGKTASHILHVPFRRFPSLVAGATTFPPTSWWDYGCLAMEPWASAGKHRAICSVPRMGWQGNTIRKGAKRPENRVTRFPVEKVRRSRIRGSRVAANHQNAYYAI